MARAMRPAMSAAIAFAAAGFAGAVAQAQEVEAPSPPALVEGVHYVKLPVPAETRDPNRIEVVEVFNYACAACYRLEPILETWLATQEDDVDFHRLPLVSARSPALVTYAQAYFTAEILDLLPSVHMEIFEAIHDHGLDMSRPTYVRRLFTRAGNISEEKFQSVFDSFGVRTRVRQADGQGRVYRIMATPSMVVNGRYVAEASIGGAELMLVVNALIDMERKAAAER